MNNTPTVFLSYASENRQVVVEIYEYLKSHGIDVWFDKESLQPGQDWQYEIEVAIENCDFFICCFSETLINKTGFVQKELKKGIDLLDMQPEGKVFFIPIRLDECRLPRSVAKYQWLDWFSTEQQNRIIGVIKNEFSVYTLSKINNSEQNTIINLTDDYSQLNSEPLFEYSSHRDWVISVEFKQSIPIDDKYCDFVTAGRDRKVVYWEGDGTNYRPYEIIVDTAYGGLNHASFNPVDESIICTSDENGYIHILSLDSKSVIEQFKAHEYLVTHVCFSPSGKQILSSGNDNIIRVWDTSNQSLVLEISGHTDGMIGRGWGSKGSPSRFRKNGVDNVNFSPDSSKIISASYDGTARMWDINTGAEIMRLIHRNWVMSACFSPDGKQILTAGHDNVARLWDAKTGHEIMSFTGHSRWIRRASFSSNGRFIVTASEDRTSRIFDTVSGKELKQFTHHNLVTDAKLSPDLYFLATTTADRLSTNVRLWNVSDLRALIE